MGHAGSRLLAQLGGHRLHCRGVNLEVAQENVGQRTVEARLSDALDVGGKFGSPHAQVIAHESPLLFDELDGPGGVASRKGLNRTPQQNCTKCQLKAHVVFRLIVLVYKRDHLGTVRRKHRIAGVLHEQVIRGGVHAFVRVGNVGGVLSVADKNMQVIDVELGSRTLAPVIEENNKTAVALVKVVVTRAGRIVALAERPEQLSINLTLEKPAKKLVFWGKAY